VTREAQLLISTDHARFVDAVRALLASTQSGKTTLAEFEPRFLHLHSEMPLSTPEPSAEAIEDLFWVVEDFVAEPTLRRRRTRTNTRSSRRSADA
jgi:hypothetical protein